MSGIVNDLEDAIIMDYALWKNVVDKLNKQEKTDDFCHHYNPVHVYCRMVEQYNIPQKDAFDYLKNRFESMYNMKCKYEKNDGL